MQVDKIFNNLDTIHIIGDLYASYDNMTNSYNYIRYTKSQSIKTVRFHPSGYVSYSNGKGQTTISEKQIKNLLSVELDKRMKGL